MVLLEFVGSAALDDGRLEDLVVGVMLAVRTSHACFLFLLDLLGAHLAHAHIFSGEFTGALVGDAHPPVVLAAYSTHKCTPVGVVLRVVAVRSSNAHFLLLVV